MAALMPQGKQQYFTAGGIPLVGGKVYTYAAGTTTPLATYTTAAASTPNTNPVILDSRGEASIFFSAANYKIVVKDSLDSTIWTQDNLPGDAAATIVANLAASTGSSLVGHIASGAGAVASTVQAKLRECISVKDFGAVGDGVTDDTAAIQAALNAAKGANGTGVGRTVFALHIPNPTGGFYKITDTLVIDGTNGLHVFGDGALTKREIATPEGVLRWYGASSKPVIQVKGGTGSPSNPNFQIKISDLTISGYQAFVTPGSVPAALALSGIHIGNLDTQNDNTLTRNLVIDNVRVTDCRFGIWSGNPDALNTDHASVYLSNSYIARNAQAGICWGTGNAVLNASGNHVTDNGWGDASFAADDYSLQIGANVHVVSGYVDLVSLTTAGSSTYKPSTADIYQASGHCSIINAWSDTEGYFYYQGGASLSGTGYHVGQITGVRHFNGSMTVGNTPTSMYIRVPGTTVSSCMVYGDIEVASGLSGRPVFSGINFARAGATFTGTGVTAQRSLINHGHGAGNSAQTAMGGRNAGVALSHAGYLVPQLLSMGAGQTTGVELFQMLGAASTDSGVNLTFNPFDGSIEIYSNCYVYDASFNFRAHKAGPGHRIVIGGISNAIRMYVYDFPNTTTSVAYTSFSDIGGVKLGGAAGFYTEATLQHPMRAAAPTYTSGDWWEGSTYYNTTTNKLQVNTGGGTWVDLH